jgi:hypothetical protein
MNTCRQNGAQGRGRLVGLVVAGLTTLALVAACSGATPRAGATPGVTTSASGPRGSTSPSASPLVPAEVMLIPADVAPGDATVREAEGDWALEFLSLMCGRIRLTPDSDYVEPIATREQQITGALGLVQAVSIYPPGGAAWRMDETRQLVRDCATISFENERWSMAIVESGFAGDDSVMVKATPFDIDGLGPRYHVYIRQGELLTQIRFDHQTAAQRRSAAAAAARRLCAATVAAC